MAARHALPETRRLAYLQAMGVDSYFPRVALAGAPPSVLCELPPRPEALAEPPLAPENATDSAPQTGGSPQALRDLLPSVAATARPATGKRAQAGPASPEADGVRFTLRFFQVPGSTLLIDASPEAAPEARLQRLATNLLLAISRLDGDAAAGATNVQQHIFRWPMVGNSQVARSEQAAREAVAAAVQGNCERHGFSRVLLMGELAQRYAATPVAGVRLLPCESLAHYLATPAAKARLWRDLLDDRKP